MDKRALKREYKESEIPMGIYRIWNKRNDRSLVGSSLNLPAILNRSRQELRLGGHRNRLRPAPALHDAVDPLPRASLRTRPRRNRSRRGVEPRWQILPHPTKARALITAEQWMGNG